MSINVERLSLLIGAALVGALVANSIRPGVRVVVRQKERLVGGHDATGEPIAPRMLAIEHKPE